MILNEKKPTRCSKILFKKLKKKKIAVKNLIYFILQKPDYYKYLARKLHYFI